MCAGAPGIGFWVRSDRAKYPGGVTRNNCDARGLNIHMHRLRGPLEFLQASYTRAVSHTVLDCEPAVDARALNPSCGLGSHAPFFAVAPKASSTKPEYRQ